MTDPRPAPLMKPSERLFSSSRENRVPLLCTFELTTLCNLRCRHCYLSCRRTGLPSRTIKDILTQLAAAGTLHLIFTGGEVLLRKDFLDLCRFARGLSFDLRIFTNGTLLDEETAKQLAAASVSGVEISLYGRRTIHDVITGERGSFDRSLSAIGHLQRFNVPVTIKTPLMSVNFKDRSWLASFASRRKIACRFDPVIAPRNNGDTSVLKYRLTPPQLKTLYHDPAFTPDIKSLKHLPDLSCSAGENLVAIAADGTVYPCLQLLAPIGTLKTQSFDRIWSSRNKALATIRNAAFSGLSECDDCTDAPLCQRCPGMALLEDGDLSAPSRIACTIAKIHRNLLR